MSSGAPGVSRKEPASFNPHWPPQIYRQPSVADLIQVFTPAQQTHSVTGSKIEKSSRTLPATMDLEKIQRSTSPICGNGSSSSYHSSGFDSISPSPSSSSYSSSPSSSSYISLISPSSKEQLMYARLKEYRDKLVTNEKQGILAEESEHIKLTEDEIDQRNKLINKILKYINKNFSHLKYKHEDFKKLLSTYGKFIVDEFFENKKIADFSVKELEDLKIQMRDEILDHLLKNHPFFQKIIKRLQKIYNFINKSEKNIAPWLTDLRRKLFGLISHAKKGNVINFIQYFDSLNDYNYLQNIVLKAFRDRKSSGSILAVFRKWGGAEYLETIGDVIEDAIKPHRLLTRSLIQPWIETDKTPRKEKEDRTHPDLIRILNLNGQNVWENLIRKDIERPDCFLMKEFKFSSDIYYTEKGAGIETHPFETTLTFDALEGSYSKRMHTVLKTILTHLYSTNYDVKMAKLSGAEREKEIDELLSPLLNENTTIERHYKWLESLRCFPIFQYLCTSSIALAREYFQECYSKLHQDPIKTEHYKSPDGDMITTGSLHISNPYTFSTNLSRRFKVSIKTPYIYGEEKNSRSVCSLILGWNLIYERNTTLRVVPKGYIEIKVEEWFQEATPEDRELVRNALLEPKTLDLLGLYLVRFEHKYDLPSLNGLQFSLETT